MRLAAQAPCVLLISPGIIKWTDMDFGLPHLVSMGGYLLREVGESRVRVELLDLNYEGTDHQTLARRLEDLGPLLCIGLSCYSSFDYMRVLTLGRFLKGLYPDIPLITGGYHASALPQDLIFDGSPFDAVIKGEGEQALVSVVESLLAGERIEQPFIDGGVVEDLDSLPMYRWDLLNRYWPHAHEIGRKFQIYLSRGCPYRCAFCMERAKSGYQWRAYSPQRALAELEHLSSYTDLERWVINLADPLFGLKRSWRREVLEGMIDRGLTPRQYWTLTRSDDLQEEDVELLARARFSIGIGMESGSPRMLEIMQKGNKPEAYLGALERLAKLSRKHGLNWAANVIIGHPGEDLVSMKESFNFVERLFTHASETCGWLSIDPFRLYPGALIHEERARYEREHGTRFYHPTWWREWFDGGFKAELIDPSDRLSFEQRVNFMYDRYPALVEQILARFKGQGRSVDQVFRRSIDAQLELMSPSRRESLLRSAAHLKARSARRGADQAHTHQSNADQPTNGVPSSSSAPISSALNIPIGLNIRDEGTRRREDLVRLLLEVGALRSERVIEAMLTVDPREHLSDEVAEALLRSPYASPPLGSRSPQPESLSLYALAVGLEALAPCEGDTVLDALATSSYVSALLESAVGVEGRVVALRPTTHSLLKQGATLGDVKGFSALSRWWRSGSRSSDLRGQSDQRQRAQRAQRDQGDQGDQGDQRGQREQITARDQQRLTLPLHDLAWAEALAQLPDLTFDGIWLGAALPRAPQALLRRLTPPMGRLVTLLGPRFRPQDLVCLSRGADGALKERALGRSLAPVAVGRGGWVNR